MLPRRIPNKGNDFLLGEEDDEDDWENIDLNLDELSEELVVAGGVALELTLAETEEHCSVLMSSLLLSESCHKQRKRAERFTATGYRRSTTADCAGT